MSGTGWPASENDRLEPTLERDLSGVLNRYSQENASNTPDWILAQFLLGCLAAWNMGVQQREAWYGRDARPIATGGDGPSPIDPADESARMAADGK